MSHLVPCPLCERHVRATEAACPFCGATADFAKIPVVGMPKARLGRAAMFAFGATVAATLSTAACGSDDDGGSGGTAGTGGAATGGSSGKGGSGGSGGSATGGTAGSSSGGTAGTASGGVAGLSADYGSPPFDSGT